MASPIDFIIRSFQCVYVLKHHVDALFSHCPGLFKPASQQGSRSASKCCGPSSFSAPSARGSYKPQLSKRGVWVPCRDEHSEQARAPHTNGPRGVLRCGALSLLQKTLHNKGVDGGAHAIVRGGARCASQVLHRFAQAVSRGAARFVRRRCLIVVPRPIPEVPRMHLMVVYRPLPATPLVVRCVYMAVVSGPMPAAVASRCFRRWFQQLVCACGS